MSLRTMRVQGQMEQGFAVTMQCGSHTLVMDQPRAAAGTDAGPTPLDVVLAALGGCFGTIGRFLAHQRKIELRGMRFDIEADYDPNGLLGRNLDVRPGFQAIRLGVDIDADLTTEQKQEFLQEVERRCPLADNLLHGVQLHTQLAD
ncbi:MAG: OsmC family protein [Pseudomonas sp.]